MGEVMACLFQDPHACIPGLLGNSSPVSKFTDFLSLDWDNSGFWTRKQFQTKSKKMDPV